MRAARNIDPAQKPSELALTEAHLMGSHASGLRRQPEDIAPKVYFRGYNRMGAVACLFTADDGRLAHGGSSRGQGGGGLSRRHPRAEPGPGPHRQFPRKTLRQSSLQSGQRGVGHAQAAVHPAHLPKARPRNEVTA